MPDVMSPKAASLTISPSGRTEREWSRGLNSLHVSIMPIGQSPSFVASHTETSTDPIYVRNDRNDAHISDVNNAGCSQAAKCPPLGSLL